MRSTKNKTCDTVRTHCHPLIPSPHTARSQQGEHYDDESLMRTPKCRVWHSRCEHSSDTSNTNFAPIQLTEACMKNCGSHMHAVVGNKAPPLPLLPNTTFAEIHTLTLCAVRIFSRILRKWAPTLRHVCRSVDEYVARRANDFCCIFLMHCLCCCLMHRLMEQCGTRRSP